MSTLHVLTGPSPKETLILMKSGLINQNGQKSQFQASGNHYKLKTVVSSVNGKKTLFNPQ